MLKFFIAFTFIALFSVPQITHAIDIIPSSKSENSALEEAADTHPPIKLTPDKSELIRLGEKAGSVIIGNPEHVSILAENAQTLVLVPGIAGATHITILDQDANILMRRHVVIAHPKERYVRIRKPCRGDDEACEPTRVYFCPDMCHEINIPTIQESASIGDSASTSAGGIGNTPETPDDVEE